MYSVAISFSTQKQQRQDKGYEFAPQHDNQKREMGTLGQQKRQCRLFHELGRKNNFPFNHNAINKSDPDDPVFRVSPYVFKELCLIELIYFNPFSLFDVSLP
jgi:hypothetical protein